MGVVSWWSPTVPKTRRSDMNSSEVDPAQTQQPRHSANLSRTMKKAYGQPGGRGPWFKSVHSANKKGP